MYNYRDNCSSCHAHTERVYVRISNKNNKFVGYGRICPSCNKFSKDSEFDKKYYHGDYGTFKERREVLI
jgi:hypothetical protein